MKEEYEREKLIMKEKRLYLLQWRGGKAFVSMLAVLSLMLMMTLNALASTVNISDPAGILNANKVRNEASSLPDRLDIYTTSNFGGSIPDFNQEAMRSIPNPNGIVMAISTNLGYVTIVGGNQVGLSTSQYSDARNSFISSYKNNHDYTEATIAAIDSLNSALGGSGSGGLAGFVILAGVVVVIIIVAFIAIRSGHGWALLSAVLSGLAGYELGKEAGKRDSGRFDDEGNRDFGGGAGGSFRDNNSNSGGGGNFGGGGGNFGGGGGRF
jgi:hypothetical protein